MSRDAQHPRRADRPRGAVDVPDATGPVPRAGGRHPGSRRAARRPDGSDPTRPVPLPGDGPGAPAGGLFDDTGLRTVGRGRYDDLDYGADRQGQRRPPGRMQASPILGSGPEISRTHRRAEPTGRHEALRTAPFAPTAAGSSLSTPFLERALDFVHRWRSPLGLGLAAVITVGVVAVYQRSTSDDTAAADGTGAESRSAIAAATEFDESATTAPGTDGTGDAAPTASTTVTTVPGSDPASPTTASTTPSSTPTTTPTSPTNSAPATTPTTTPPTSPTTPSSSDPATTPPTTPPTSPTTTPSSDPATTPSSTPSTPPTTATPPPPVQAETGTLQGAAEVRTDQAGFTGTGFVGNIIAEGDGVAVTVTSAGGPTPFSIGYSAGPVDGAPALRTLSILVDGTRITEAQMRATATWDDWDIVGGTLDLPAGDVTITIVMQATDTGQANIDYVQVG